MSNLFKKHHVVTGKGRVIASFERLFSAEIELCEQLNNGVDAYYSFFSLGKKRKEKKKVFFGSKGKKR